MAKGKVTKSVSVPNKNQHSRISFLYQAAAYLEAHSQQALAIPKQTEGASATSAEDSKALNLIKNIHNVTRKHSQLILSDMRAVSQKMQIRLSPAMKHTICKRCDTLLVDGVSCTSEIENKSKNNKPWVDVLVRTCTSCGCPRRFPLGAERQRRRSLREKEARTTDVMDVDVDVLPGS